MFAKICGNVCKDLRKCLQRIIFACLLISPEIWSGVYHFPDVGKMIGTKKWARRCKPKQSTNHYSFF